MANKMEVLLADKWTEKRDPTGRMMSEKLDGMRAIWLAEKEKYFSRDGHEIVVPDSFYVRMPKFDLDGELWGGRGTFQKTCGIARRKHAEPENWKNIIYNTFDAPTIDGMFRTRYDILFDTKLPSHAKVVQHITCDSLEHMKAYLEQVLSEGGEGIMLRDPSSLYEHKRSKTLLKVKVADDAEAVVVGYEDGEGKYTGMTGALLVKLADGVKVSVGSGLTDALRATPPPVGAVITIKFDGRTDDGVPRFPRFFRKREDVPEW